MKRLILAAGVAALALAAPVSAKPEKGGGGGNGGGKAAQVERGGGGGGGGGGGQARAQRGPRGGGEAARAQRMVGGGGREARAQRMERRGGEARAERRAARQQMERRGGEARAERRAARQQMERRGAEARAERRALRQQVERRAQRTERANDRRFAVLQANREERRAQRQQRGGDDRREARALRERFEQRGRAERQEIREARRQNVFQDRGDRRELRQALDVAQARSFARSNGDTVFGRYLRDRDGDAIRLRRDLDDGWFEQRFANRGIPAAYVGCPPGLAKKSPACVPPGLARQALIGQVLPNYYQDDLLPLALRDTYFDTDDYYWRYGDGYAYRVDRERNLIEAVLPLIGAGLGIGMPFPYSSPSYYVPSHYQSFYPDSPYTYFRYSDGYVYEIDRDAGVIVDVVPLLDHGYGVGQILPASYSYYNLPYQYRDWYEDDDDYLYRYAPGAIYQVDRETQLITAIVSLLTGNNGLAVGQPLPIGYDVYNVPYDYRDRYYDRQDAWYRYADGRIYQVDPTTRLITAVIDAIV
jgi:hypothetical protein